MMKEKIEKLKEEYIINGQKAFFALDLGEFLKFVYQAAKNYNDFDPAEYIKMIDTYEQPFLIDPKHIKYFEAYIQSQG